MTNSVSRRFFFKENSQSGVDKAKEIIQKTFDDEYKKLTTSDLPGEDFCFTVAQLISNQGVAAKVKSSTETVLTLLKGRVTTMVQAIATKKAKNARQKDRAKKIKELDQCITTFRKEHDKDINTLKSLPTIKTGLSAGMIEVSRALVTQLTPWLHRLISLLATAEELGAKTQQTELQRIKKDLEFIINRAAEEVMGSTVPDENEELSIKINEMLSDIYMYLDQTPYSTTKELKKALLDRFKESTPPQMNLQGINLETKISDFLQEERGKNFRHFVDKNNYKKDIFSRQDELKRLSYSYFYAFDSSPNTSEFERLYTKFYLQGVSELEGGGGGGGGGAAKPL